MNHTVKALLAATGIALAAGPVAVAEKGHHGPRGAERFEEMDANGDGKISRAESEAKPTAHFAEADANSDGVLTAAELSALHEARRAEKRAEREARMFDRLDADDDGKVTPAEFKDRAKRRFDALDADNDGFVSKEEAEAARGRRGGRRGPPPFERPAD